MGLVAVPAECFMEQPSAIVMNVFNFGSQEWMKSSGPEMSGTAFCIASVSLTIVYRAHNLTRGASEVAAMG